MGAPTLTLASVAFPSNPVNLTNLTSTSGSGWSIRDGDNGSDFYYIGGANRSKYQGQSRAFFVPFADNGGTVPTFSNGYADPTQIVWNDYDLNPDPSSPNISHSDVFGPGWRSSQYNFAAGGINAGVVIAAMPMSRDLNKVLFFGRFLDNSATYSATLTSTDTSLATPPSIIFNPRSTYTTWAVLGTYSSRFAAQTARLELRRTAGASAGQLAVNASVIYPSTPSRRSTGYFNYVRARGAFGGVHGA